MTCQKTQLQVWQVIQEAWIYSLQMVASQMLVVIKVSKATSALKNKDVTLRQDIQLQKTVRLPVGMEISSKISLTYHCIPLRNQIRLAIFLRFSTIAVVTFKEVATVFYGRRLSPHICDTLKDPILNIGVNVPLIAVTLMQMCSAVIVQTASQGIQIYGTSAQ
tara:strand:+ start:1019 stop:1507 length:489 start_codon:yes stop_codon:yes gene_type:complete